MNFCETGKYKITQKQVLSYLYLGTISLPKHWQMCQTLFCLGSLFTAAISRNNRDIVILYRPPWEVHQKGLFLLITAMAKEPRQVLKYVTISDVFPMKYC